MSRDDTFIVQLEDYLDEFEGLTPLPDGVRAAVRAELPRTKQSRPLPGLARFPTMNNQFRIAVAAAAIVVATAIGIGIFMNNNVGPAPEPAPSPSTSAGAADVPVELQHHFLGPAHANPEINVRDGALLEITRNTMAYDGGFGRTLLSTASVAGPGQIRFLTTPVSGLECPPDSVGLYPYALSTGGSLLTISEGTDGCPARAAAVVGEWQVVRCKSADNDCLGDLEAGSYSSSFFEPRPDTQWAPRFGAMTFTVPEGWANYVDAPDSFGLTTQEAYASVPGDECFDCPGTRDAITVLGDPGAATLDCAETNVEGVVSRSDLVGWLTTHPGLEHSTPVEGELNGMPATSLDIQPRSDWTGMCDAENRFVAVPVFYRLDSYHWALPMGDRWHLIIVELGGAHILAIVTDSDPDNLEAFVAEVTPIIDSFAFPPH